MIVKEIADALEAWAPPPIAESYDNVGLLVGNPYQEVNGALINLDMTEEVVDEALQKNLNLIIAHHPIWFSARKRLNGEDYVSRTIIKAVKHDIGLYACHTNLDNVQDGVNRKIAEKLGLENTDFLRPHREGQYGSGMVGFLPEPMPKAAFLQWVKKTFSCGGIRYADCAQTLIHKVAVCGGAGSFLTPDAMNAEVDALVTADITYHKFFDNEGKFLLMDIGHYESEQFTSEMIHQHLSEKFPKFAVHLSEHRTNPVRYF